MGVEEVSEEDQKKHKKLAKAPDLGIKVSYYEEFKFVDFVQEEIPSQW